MSLRVSDIMTADLVTLEEHEDLSLADSIMALGRIRHLPVVTDGALVGLVTHRDILASHAARPQAGDSVAEATAETAARRRVLAGDIMTREVRTVSPETTVLDAARIIHEHKLGCLPVVDGGKLVGIVTEADFVQLVIRGLEAEADA